MQGTDSLVHLRDGGDVVRQRGVDESRANGIDANSFGSQAHSHIARQLHHRALAGNVGFKTVGDRYGSWIADQAHY